MKSREDTQDIRSHVRERYGAIAREFQPQTGSASCCGPAESSCCDVQDDAPALIALEEGGEWVTTLYEAADVTELPPEVTGLSLGCGDPVTLARLKAGQTVLDLGSGGGIDCFLAAKRVGPSGRVIGVDMTPSMLEKARANKAKLGAENVEFRLGEIEHLPVADDSVDVVVSNCVINLSPDKPQVFREAYRVLQPGGRLAVSDIVTDGPLPDEIKGSLSAWAGCIAGALDAKDYIAAIEAAGFVDVELVPVYWDKSLVDTAIEQLDLGDVAKDSDHVLGMRDGARTEVVQLGEPVDVSAESLYKAVFSAKVTARKPAG